MKAPKKTELRRMEWARKRVNLDGTTKNNFPWPLGGGWVEQDGPANGEACGVGLHLGKTWRGLSMGGNLTEAIGLVVGYLPEDVLGEDADKVRVRRCWVAPLTFGFAQVARTAGRGANLRGADLRGADLRGADLRGANLRGANLRDADLRDANLWDADLRGADLRGADLRGADLRGANLRGANLRDANLWDAYGNNRTTLPAHWKVNESGLIVKAES